MIGTDPGHLEETMIDGRFMLRERLGEGAFGVMYRGEQWMLGVPTRRVAVKLSRRTGLTEQSAREQMGEALRLAAATDELIDAEARRHLVQVYDAGVLAHSGRAFVAMEFVQGTTLAEQFRRYQQVPIRLLSKWTREIAIALRGLHTLAPPLLHRDLKPDNVLLGVDGAVRLVDFGLAARVVAQGYVPGAAGTLAYMAPEASQGESVPASDLYSLGLLLYRGLTGRHPFEHLVPPLELAADLHRDWLYDARSRSAPAPPSALNRGVSPQLDTLVLRCLLPDPARRPDSAAELIELLDGRPGAGEEEAKTPLQHARRLETEHDVSGALRILEQALGTPDTPAVRFALLTERGRLLCETGDHQRAVDSYVEAWRLVEANPALLRSRSDRAALLAKVAAAYRSAGNAYQQAKFEHLRARELGEEQA